MPMSPRLLRPRAPGGYRHALLRQGLVAYWTLNENAATGDILAIDETGRGNHLASNSTVPSVAGKFGNAREFVAANSEWLSRADNADLRLGNDNWTLSAWVYVPTAANGTQMVMAKDGDSTERDWSLSIERNTGTSANRLSFNLFYTSGFAGTVTFPNRTNANFINNWWLFTAVNSSGLVTLYENGAVVSGTGSVATFTRASGQTFAATSASFTIGRRIRTAEPNYFTGYVDEVAKWNRALSAEEISQLWNNGNGINLAAPRESTGPFAAVTNAEAQDWINRVYANGGTVSTSTAAAVNTFCNAIDAAGIRDRFYRLNLFCGTGLAAALVPLYRNTSFAGSVLGNATDTNSNFVSGDYSETGSTGGIIGNGTTKFLDTGLAGNTVTFGNLHLSCYVVTAASAGNFRPLVVARSTTNADEAGLYNHAAGLATTAYFAEENTGTGFVAGTTNNPNGFLVGSSTSTTDRRFFRNGAQEGSTTTIALTRTQYPTNSFRIMQNQSTGGTGNSRVAAYSIGFGLTAAQVSAFYTAMQAFQTALSRNV